MTPLSTRVALAAALRDPGTLVRGMTARQPWTSRIAYAGKDVENRTRRPSHTGLILVHAGLHVDEEAMRETSPGLRHLDARGAVLAVATLADSHHDDECSGRCSVWAQPDRRHWEIRDVHPLPLPVPATGALYLWSPDTDVRERVAAALELPQRIQRERTPGWRLPSGAMVVDRSSRFGNPFRMGRETDRATAVQAHRQWLAGARDLWAGDAADHARERVLADLPLLRGQDLACPCSLGEMCHADELIRVSNLPPEQFTEWVAAVRARVDRDRRARGERPLRVAVQLTFTD